MKYNEVVFLCECGFWFYYEIKSGNVIQLFRTGDGRYSTKRYRGCDMRLIGYDNIKYTPGEIKKFESMRPKFKYNKRINLIPNIITVVKRLECNLCTNLLKEL